MGLWGVRNLGSFPVENKGSKKKGEIYRWRIQIGPLEIRCWA